MIPKGYECSMEDDSLSEKEKVDFDKNSLLEVLEKNYYFELERRNHIDRKINVPIGKLHPRTV